MFQIELQEQRSSGRGSKSKDSKRKRKNLKTEGEPKPTEASECKKTKSTDPHTGTHCCQPHIYLLSNVCDQKQTYLLFSYRCCDDFLKLWKGGRCERENHRDRKMQASGSFPHIISSHKFFQPIKWTPY